MTSGTSPVSTANSIFNNFYNTALTKKTKVALEALKVYTKDIITERDGQHALFMAKIRSELTATRKSTKIESAPETQKTSTTSNANLQDDAAVYESSYTAKTFTSN